MDKSTLVFLFGLIVTVSVAAVNDTSGSVELISSDCVAVSGGNRLTKLFDSGCDVAKKTGFAVRYYVLADFVAESLSDATGIDVDKRLIPCIPLRINARGLVNVVALVVWFKLIPNDMLIKLGLHLGFFVYRYWNYIIKSFLVYRVLSSQGLQRVFSVGSLLYSFAS